MRKSFEGLFGIITHSELQCILLGVEYREPVLAFANTPDQEIPVQGEANLGDKGRYHPSVAAQIVNGKFGASSALLSPPRPLCFVWMDTKSLVARLLDRLGS